MIGQHITWNWIVSAHLYAEKGGQVKETEEYSFIPRPATSYLHCFTIQCSDFRSRVNHTSCLEAQGAKYAGPQVMAEFSPVSAHGLF